MHQVFYSLIVLSLYSSSLSAQLHDNHWAIISEHYSESHNPRRFEQAMISFDSGEPIVWPNDNAFTMRQCGTTISDKEGNLLFYTNGYTVANADHKVMVNGDSLNFDHDTFLNYANGSLAVQDIVALPDPADELSYYLLHVNSKSLGLGTTVGTHLLYSKVNMTMDGGMGAVVDKNTIVLEDTILCGGLTAVQHANGRDWWVLVFRFDAPQYYRILVSPNGVTNMGLAPMEPRVIKNKLGNLKFTNDGEKLIVIPTTHDSLRRHWLHLFDFDRCAGFLSNEQTIHYYEQFDFSGNGTFYEDRFAVGNSISPNSRYLYLNVCEEVLQMDLWAEDPGSTLQTIAEWDGFYDSWDQYRYIGVSKFAESQLGPDGKIYSVSCGLTTYYHVTHQPNNPGLTCKLEQNSLKLPGTHSYAVPNHLNYRLGPLEGSGCDTLDVEKAIYFHANPYPDEGCVGGAAHFEVTVFGTQKAYQWQASADGGITWKDLEDDAHHLGVHSEYLILQNIEEDMDGMLFRCRASGNVDEKVSRLALLSVTGALPTAHMEVEQVRDSIYFFDTSEGSEYGVWYFGDGDSSVLADATHVYPAAGTYTAALVAHNACGTDTFFQEFIIEPLTVDFFIEKTFGCAPFTTTITSLAPYRCSPLYFHVENGEPWGWEAMSDSHSYDYLEFEIPGVYDATHKVWADGTTAEITKEDYITVIEGPNPVADIELTQNGTQLSLHAPFGLADEYTWYFAGGDSLTGQSVEYEMEAPGIYEVQLATTNHCGTDVGSIDILIGELEAAFSSDVQSGCAPLTVKFENQTQFAKADFIWHLGGAQPVASNEMAPEVTYTVPGLYEVRLIVWADSLSDTLTIENYIEVYEDDCPLSDLITSVDGQTLSAWTSCPDDLSHTWLLGNGDELSGPAIAYEYPEAGIYEVEVIVENNCGLDTLTTVVEIEVSSAEEQKAKRQVHLAPNPAGESVNVLSQNPVQGKAGFELFNAFGQRVLSKEKESWESLEKINLVGLLPGVYLYRFYSSHGEQNGRLIVH